jgi:hypothetical protein
LSHQPFLLVSTYPLAGAGFNKVNGLASQSRTAREPLLARCDNARARQADHPSENETPLPPRQAEVHKGSLAPASPPQTSDAEASSASPVWCYALIRRVRTIAGWFWYDKSLLMTWLFRFLTLTSVFYLVYDRLHETNLTVSVVGSDPNDPFKYPFSIKNSSHIFSMSTIQWKCLLISVEGAGLHMGHDVLGFSTVSTIPAGQNLNITCDPSNIFRIEPKPKITLAVIQILLSYNVDILWLIHWRRVPDPAIFTWAGNTSNPQWVRGNFAR